MSKLRMPYHWIDNNNSTLMLPGIPTSISRASTIVLLQQS